MRASRSFSKGSSNRTRIGKERLREGGGLFRVGPQEIGEQLLNDCGMVVTEIPGLLGMVDPDRVGENRAC